jgi:hypothetical protein
MTYDDFIIDKILMRGGGGGGGWCVNISLLAAVLRAISSSPARAEGIWNLIANLIIFAPYASIKMQKKRS